MGKRISVIFIACLVVAAIIYFGTRSTQATSITIAVLNPVPQLHEQSGDLAKTIIEELKSGSDLPEKIDIRYYFASEGLNDHKLTMEQPMGGISTELWEKTVFDTVRQIFANCPLTDCGERAANLALAHFQEIAVSNNGDGQQLCILTGSLPCGYKPAITRTVSSNGNSPIASRLVFAMWGEDVSARGLLADLKSSFASTTDKSFSYNRECDAPANLVIFSAVDSSKAHSLAKSLTGKLYGCTGLFVSTASKSGSDLLIGGQLASLEKKIYDYLIGAKSSDPITCKFVFAEMQHLQDTAIGYPRNVFLVGAIPTNGGMILNSAELDKLARNHGVKYYLSVSSNPPVDRFQQAFLNAFRSHNAHVEEIE
jgi:hypothetical protein